MISHTFDWDNGKPFSACLEQLNSSTSFYVAVALLIEMAIRSEDLLLKQINGENGLGHNLFQLDSTLLLDTVMHKYLLLWYIWYKMVINRHVAILHKKFTLLIIQAC